MKGPIRVLAGILGLLIAFYLAMISILFLVYLAIGWAVRLLKP